MNGFTDELLIPWIAEVMGVEIWMEPSIGEGFYLMGTDERFNPFTGDWMLKGMGVMAKGGISCDLDLYGELTVWATNDDRLDNQLHYICEDFDGPREIPRVFWVAWYRWAHRKETT